MVYMPTTQFREDLRGGGGGLGGIATAKQLYLTNKLQQLHCPLRIEKNNGLHTMSCVTAGADLDY